MTNAAEFIENFLAHNAVDKAKIAEYNRQYYLKNRKLKGRAAGQASKPADPRSQKMYNGQPLKPLGKRIEEDETPDVSPTGAKLVDYNGDGLGKATYADGSVYDAKVGWKQGGQSAVNSAVNANNANRKLTGIKPLAPITIKTKRRIGAAEQKLIRAKTLAKRVKDPSDRAELMKRLQAAEKKLKRTMERTGSSPKDSMSVPVKRKSQPKHTKPDKAGRPPGHPDYGNDPPARKGVRA